MFKFRMKLYLLLVVLELVGNALGGNPTMKYNQYKYIGFRNTWHDGMAHEVEFLIGILEGFLSLW